MRGYAVRMSRVKLGGVRVARVHISAMTVATVTVGTVAVATMSVAGVPVSIVSDMGEAANRHRGEASTAQREAKPIDVHTPNTTCRAAGW